MITGDVLTLSLNTALHKDYVPALAFGAQSEDGTAVLYLPSRPT